MDRIYSEIFEKIALINKEKQELTEIYNRLGVECTDDTSLCEYSELCDEAIKLIEKVPVTHEWNGTILTITSASGTSSVDLKGVDGKSAYESALEGGYKGTEEEFAEQMALVASVVAYGGETEDLTEGDTV